MSQVHLFELHHFAEDWKLGEMPSKRASAFSDETDVSVMWLVPLERTVQVLLVSLQKWPFPSLINMHGPMKCEMDLEQEKAECVMKPTFFFCSPTIFP